MNHFKEICSEEHQLLVQSYLCLGEVGQVGHHQQVLQQRKRAFTFSSRRKMTPSVKCAYAPPTASQANKSQGLRGRKDRPLTADVTRRLCMLDKC